MADGEGTSKGPRVLALRYGGRCQVCGAELPKRTEAWWDPASRKVRCVGCAPVDTAVNQAAALDRPGVPEAVTPIPAAAPALPAIDRGVAGRSAAKKYERQAGRYLHQQEEAVRRDAEWRAEQHAHHPILGRFRTAMVEKPIIAPPPQHVRAWGTGANGERLLGGVLDPLEAAVGAVVLHDRRIPGHKENIDHIVVAPTGVWAVDAKLYAGKLVEQTSVGSLFRPAVELRVAGRSRMHLVEQSHRQVFALGTFLADAGFDGVAARGMLCFIDAEWRLFSKPIHIDGVLVAWPKAAVEALRQPGPLTPDHIHRVAAAVAQRFPAA